MFFSKFRPMVRIRGRTAGSLLGVAALGSIVLATVLAPVASAAPPGSVVSGDIALDVFANPTVGNSTFVTPTLPPVFHQDGFPNLTFNPPNNPPGSSSNANICSAAGTTTYENARPFVFVNPETCHVRIVRNAHSTAQAGVDLSGSGGANLNEFEVEFTGHIHINQPGNVVFTALVDDQAIVGLGPQEDLAQPTDPDGSGTTAKKGLKVMFTAGLGSTTSTVFFPATGSYPIEVDYVECCGSTLFMTLLANGVPLLNQ